MKRFFHASLGDVLGFSIGLQHEVRPSNHDRPAARRAVETTGRVKRTIPSLRDGGMFESFGLAVMFAVVIAVVAYGYAKLALFACL